MSFVSVLCALLAATASPTTKPAATRPAASLFAARPVAIADTAEVAESSGVVASRVNPGIYWTHNDSGDGPFVFPFRLTDEDRARQVAHVLGAVELEGAKNKDWEDIAWGPGNRIYLFDGGDNPPCKRDGKHVYRFTEPRLDPNAPHFKMRLPCESMRFEYPDSQHPDRPADRNDQRYDAECFFVHPATGDFYIVTKRDTKKVPVALVFKYPAARIRWDDPRAIHILEFVTDLTPKVRGLLDAFTLINAVTGGDIDSTGTRVVIRDYLKAMEFVLPSGAPFEKIFDQKPVITSLAGEPQGEGVCYTLDGHELITTSEVAEFKRTHFPVFAYPSPTFHAATQPARTP